MSNKALNWAWAAKIPHGPKFTLVALADHGSDHDGEDWSCFPSPERLMDFTGFPLRTLERHLEWLDLMGWITRIADRDGRGRLVKRSYRLHRNPRPKPGWEKLVKSKASEGCPPANMAGGETADPPAKNPPDQPPKSDDPAANLAGGLYIAEPPTNPQEPTERARGTGARELARWLWSFWPEGGKRGVSSPRQVEAAIAAELAEPDWDEAKFRAGARVYAAERKTWGKSGSPKAAHNFVKAATWRGFEIDEEWSPPSGSGWHGPAEIRVQLVGLLGEDRVRSTLDVASWDGAAIVARTRWAADQLRTALRGSDVVVLDPVKAGLEGSDRG